MAHRENARQGVGVERILFARIGVMTYYAGVTDHDTLKKAVTTTAFTGAAGRL